MNNGEWAIVLVTVIFVGIPLAFSACRYAQVRRSEQRQQRFENYHKIIRWLVEGYPDSKAVMLDSQIAIVYELQNFREYSEVSIRILEGLQQKWKVEDKSGRLVNEISLTLQKLKRG